MKYKFLYNRVAVLTNVDRTDPNGDVTVLVTGHPGFNIAIYMAIVVADAITAANVIASHPQQESLLKMENQ